MSGQQRVVNAEIGTNILLDRNTDGSFRRLLNISFRHCRLPNGDAFRELIRIVLNRAMDRLHRNVPNAGVFRYVVRSPHLLRGAFSMQAEFCNRKLSGDEAFTRILKVVNSENTTKVFRGHIAIELCYTPRNSDPEYDPCQADDENLIGSRSAV